MDVIRHEKELSGRESGLRQLAHGDVDASEFFLGFKVKHPNGIVESIAYVRVLPMPGLTTGAIAVSTDSQGCC